MSSFPTGISSMKLKVSTFEQDISSASLGNNSIQINEEIKTAFNNQPAGTIFNPSIVTTYDAGSFPSGDTLLTTSVSNFVLRPLILSNFGPFSYNYVSGGVGTFTLPEPSSDSTSPGAFTYSVVGSTGVVSISTNVATMLSAGTTTIRATQAAAGGYTSAYVEASVTINPIAPTFSNGGGFTISSKNFGDASFTPAYPTSNSSGAFTYTSSAPSVATVNSITGLVTIVSVGTTTIRATQAAAGGYTSAYVEASVTIAPSSINEILDIKRNGSNYRVYYTLTSGRQASYVTTVSLSSNSGGANRTPYGYGTISPNSYYLDFSSTFIQPTNNLFFNSISLYRGGTLLVSKQYYQFTGGF